MRPSSQTSAVGDAYSTTPGGRVPRQRGPVIAKVCAAPPVVREPGDGEDVGPAVEHRQQEVAVAHVGHADHPGFFVDVEPRGRVEGVGVGRRDGPELRVRVLPHPHELTHRRGGSRGGGGVGENSPGVLHGHQRIAEHEASTARALAAFAAVGDWLTVVTVSPRVVGLR